MVIKNVLEYVHKIIMTQKKKKENPTPQDWGAGELNRRSLFECVKKLCKQDSSMIIKGDELMD